jgi:hypothetical protein
MSMKMVLQIDAARRFSAALMKGRGSVRATSSMMRDEI